MLRRRASGILLPVFSLPSRYGVGDLGPAAEQFIEFLREAKQSYWQILPLNPVREKGFYSPYDCASAFAGNDLLISPDLLFQDGLLDREDLKPPKGIRADRVDYPAVLEYKMGVFRKAFARFQEHADHRDFDEFCREHRSWLDDFALFVALKAEHKGKPWNQWPAPLRDRRKTALALARRQYAETIRFVQFRQYLFYRQWLRLKHIANLAGIHFIGDIPIYVALDSADVWSHPQLFDLTRDKRPKSVAGVPPDAFSDTGQLWGNPIYRWDRLARDDYAWWMDRIRHNLLLQDMVRIDHFRGFAGYWSVPASAKTAVSGKWVDGPGADLFRALFKYMPDAAILVEDLGVITPDVRELISQFNLPNMKVLLFGFDGPTALNQYVPHNHVPNCVIYTGTHDNNTVRGWYENEASPETKRRLEEYIGHRISASNAHWAMIRMAMRSVAMISMVPLQDILGLGQQARMNRPSTVENNWQWRFQARQLTPALARKLAEQTETYGRA